MLPTRRVLFFSQGCYLDDSNGASVASRALMEALSRYGFTVEALSGSVFESSPKKPWKELLSRPGIHAKDNVGGTFHLDSRGVRPDIEVHFRAHFRGVSLTIFRSPDLTPYQLDSEEETRLLGLLAATIDRFQPEIFVNFGGNTLANEARSLAREHGAIVVFPTHNFNYYTPEPFLSADVFIVPSQHSAKYYSDTLSLDCTVLPYFVDYQRSVIFDRIAQYLVL